jgi:hypothetical protein
MLHAPPRLPARIGVHVQGSTRDGVPVLLRGDRAAVVMASPPPAQEHVRLDLAWGDGRVTQLSARVRALDGDRHLAHLDVVGVDGSWEAFVEYLGGHARPAPTRAG